MILGATDRVRLRAPSYKKCVRAFSLGLLMHIWTSSRTGLGGQRAEVSCGGYAALSIATLAM